MDSLNPRNLKLEKANSVKKYRKLRKIANLFRFVEVCVVLVVISRFSIQLPVSVKNSGEYFRCISVFLVSPRFVFIVGNLIIIILFANSGQFSGQNSGNKKTEPDLYEEFIDKSGRNHHIHQYEIDTNKNKSIPQNSELSKDIKNYKRSQSEKSIKNVSGKSGHVLRRSETKHCRKIIVPGKSLLASGVNSEDGMSSEEFRRKIEAFIARQQQFRKEEEYSVFEGG